MIKNKTAGDLLTVSARGWGGEEVFLFLALYARSRVFADVFQKNEKKSETKSVYRLQKLVFGP